MALTVNHDNLFDFAREDALAIIDMQQIHQI